MGVVRRTIRRYILRYTRVEGPRQGMDCDGGRRLGRGSGNCEEPDETKDGDGEGEWEWQHVPPKLRLLIRGSGPSPQPKRNLDGSSVFAWLTVVSNSQTHTDHTTRIVTGRILCLAQRCGLEM